MIALRSHDTASTEVGGRAPSQPVLQLTSITKSFGDFLALDTVDFELQRGEVHGLLGENGAGKSSLMNVVAGLYAPDHGSIAIDGKPVLIRGPVDAQALRIGMVHQHYKLVMPFTAVENIVLTCLSSDDAQQLRAIRGRIEEKAALLGFNLDLDRPVSDLSIAEQQRVEILKALVGGARYLILDEPTAVLTDDEAGRLLDAVRRLADEGNSVILVTHKLHEALDHCDRITVMRGGRVVDTVLPDQVTAPDLTRMIVGETVVETPHRTQVAGDVRLRVEDVSALRSDGHKVLKQVRFDVRAGEIYGVAGVGGNGQSELVDVLTGLLRPSHGSIHLDAHGDITALRADQRRRLGMVCVPSDRQAYALAGGLSVADNFAVSGVLAGAFGSWANLKRSKIAAAARDAVNRFDVQGVREISQRAALLSGGNAQKLVIAREFSGAPSIVIAHSPSRGLDVRATAAVHDHLLAARDIGAAVILISEDLDEILLLGDRIGVMTAGTIVGEFEAPADRHAIGRLMVHHV